jgi:carbonic anhydrase
MKYLPKLFENNRAWADERKRLDPEYFERLSQSQNPDYLWIGCADSRVAPDVIARLSPGELFVHRNIANVVFPDDNNVLSVLQYSVDVLQVRHIIVCGHYRCGGVQAALRLGMPPPLENWLQCIRAVYHAHRDEIDALADDDSRWQRLCELNIVAQVESACQTEIVQAAWKRGQPLIIHGWIFDLRTGLLHDLDLSVAGSEAG